MPEIPRASSEIYFRQLKFKWNYACECGGGCGHMECPQKAAPWCQVEQKTVPDAPRQQAEVAQLIHAEVHWHLIADWAGSRVRVRVSGPGPSPNI